MIDELLKGDIMNHISTFFKDDLSVSKESTGRVFLKGILFAFLLIIAFDISNYTPDHPLWSVVSVICLVVIIAIMPYFGIHFISLKALKVSDLFIVVAALLFMFGLDNAFTYFIDDNNVNDAGIDHDFQDVPLWASIISIAIVPAFAEELVTRGIILRLFFRHHLFIGMIVSSAIFAYLHESDSLIGYLPYFYAGVIFSLVYLKTKRIEAAMLVHFLNNFLGTI
ncbi:CPBP family intramembrane glutamic endopeptidase [Staphylococcus chromogenes]|uniref:CPBP family intramembrane glutamic endopeptidase n=2 Tax=Staphylococcus chromogenes TaxID=46126 RepID=UPI000D1AAC6E|nr:type II CAAX endopeptidase family protein [Staphylococcus chromogenes]PTF68687.1 CPBP family intramembrane metalloprotease [Staphylococcus chromogenes]PTF73480.1 CPBP family intramembrane metalloprotease [Staphylococcus chromogenes]PTF77379.1 CPBP family intramembrane metalloprotease [Staphylococcus chromogenes]PTF82897.1 CPBP family intramembrane metalloprotease [Staphylococcus chromogenes]PTG51574.1 CPBP family intramembrane metalloprotease [Staphylococcus chromogenes]